MINNEKQKIEGVNVEKVVYVQETNSNKVVHWGNDILDQTFSKVWFF